MTDSDNTQRVDVEAALLAMSANIYDPGCATAGYLRTIGTGYAALLQQLADRDALIELLRNIAERERLHMQTKLRAAEGAREEAELGARRYEVVRRLNAQQFSHMFRRNVAGENFDAMVDSFLAANGGSDG